MFANWSWTRWFVGVVFNDTCPGVILGPLAVGFGPYNGTYHRRYVYDNRWIEIYLVPQRFCVGARFTPEGIFGLMLGPVSIYLTHQRSTT